LWTFQWNDFTPSMSMGYYKDNTKMMIPPKQQQDIPPRMNYTWPLSCGWTD